MMKKQKILVRKQKLSTSVVTHSQLKHMRLAEVEPYSEHDFLQAKNLFLYAFDFKKSEVYFVLVDDFFALSKAPFLFEALYHNAKEVITIDLDLFLALSKKIEVEACKVSLTLVGYTPRACSTLVCNVVGALPSYFSMSEPVCLTVLERHYSMKDCIGLEFFKASLIFLRYHVFQNGLNNLLLKPTNLSSFDAYNQVIGPQLKKIFLIRPAYDCIKSIMQKIPFHLRCLLMLRPLARHVNLDRFPIDRCHNFQTQFPYKKMHYYEQELVLDWLYDVELMLIDYDNDPRALCLSFEGICADTNQAIIKICKFLGIQDRVSLQKALEVQKSDSQSGSFLGRDYHYALKAWESKVLKKYIEHPRVGKRANKAYTRFLGKVAND